MNPDDAEQLCLKGSLLLADPSLRDGNFRRSVILLTEHRHDCGAHGYVLNRCVGQPAGQFLAGAEFKPLAAVPVYLGGPVAQEQLVFAGLEWNPDKAGLELVTHLTREDAVARLAQERDVRAFIGYSGWSAGQLEEELKQRSWITAKPVAAALSGELGDAMWLNILQAMGPWFHLLSMTPEDPGLN